MMLQDIFPDTKDFTTRYAALAKSFDIDPALLAILVAITNGMLPEKAKRRPTEKEVEHAAVAVGRVLYAFMVWLEFGPRKASSLVPLLTQIIADPEAIVISGEIDKDDVQTIAVTNDGTDAVH